jgi:heat-inducible transcriptional repressor
MHEQEVKMLDDRKRSILEAVVSEYITTGEPVSSAHIAEDYNIDCSTATIRSDMAALEKDGYLTHPHTSAGRTPTDLGYRFYVDNLDTRQSGLDTSKTETIADFFTKAHFELEQMLADTSKLLSNLTDYAAVVVAPTTDATPVVNSALLTKISLSTGILVVVMSNGTVNKFNIEITESLSEEEMAGINSLLNTHLADKKLSELPEIKTGNRKIDSLLFKCVEIPKTTAEEDRPANVPVYLGGTSKMADEFIAVRKIRDVLAILEQSYLVVTMVREVLAKGLKVSIGTENQIESLSDCSLVVAPYRISDSMFGTLAVLGPKRMRYTQVLAAVETVGEQLSKQLKSNPW